MPKMHLKWLKRQKYVERAKMDENQQNTTMLIKMTKQL